MAKLQSCRRCNGTGVEPDQVATGQAMRALREQKNLSQTLVAKRLHVSKSYLSDLELGRRGWHSKIQERFLESLK